MRTALCCVLIASGLSLGCASTPPRPAAPAPIAADAYDHVYTAAHDVLRDRGFTLDRQDYRFGVVTTEPRAVGTLFEPWLGQGQSLKTAADATLDRQRRIVRVYLLKHETRPDRYGLDVRVQRERLALPTRRVILSGNIGRTFDGLTAVPLEWQRRGIPADYWQPVDRDLALEQQLRQEILQRAQALATEQRQSAS